MDLAGEALAFGEGALAAFGGGEFAAGADQVVDEVLAAGGLAGQVDEDAGGEGGDDRGEEEVVGVEAVGEAEFGEDDEGGQGGDQGDGRAGGEQPQRGVDEGDRAPGEARREQHDHHPAGDDHGQPYASGAPAPGPRLPGHLHHGEDHAEPDDPGQPVAVAVLEDVAEQGAGEEDDEGGGEEGGEPPVVPGLGAGCEGAGGGGTGGGRWLEVVVGVAHGVGPGLRWCAGGGGGVPCGTGSRGPGFGGPVLPA